jgi:hypothetical protein
MRQHPAAMAKEAIVEFRSDSMGASHPFKVQIDHLTRGRNAIMSRTKHQEILNFLTDA